jgi:MFS family permease
MSSAGGVWGQPVLGRAADAWGYAPSYAISAGIAALGLPFLALSRRRTARGEGLATSAAPAPQPA